MQKKRRPELQIDWEFVPDPRWEERIAKIFAIIIRELEREPGPNQQD